MGHRVSWSFLVIAIFAIPPSVSAQVTGGLSGNFSGVQVEISDPSAGTSIRGGGSFTGGLWAPSDCLNQCFPGRVYSLGASWSGSDFPGSVTYPGGSYPIGMGSATVGSGTVTFRGAWTAPEYNGTSPVIAQAPFTFTARAVPPSGQPDAPIVQFAGTGTAFLTLRWSRVSGGGWIFSAATYQVHDEGPRLDLSVSANPAVPRMFDLEASLTEGTVSRVEFFVDGVLLSSSMAAPYESAWDVSALSRVGITVARPDEHFVAARAFDENGNPGVWRIVPLVVTPGDRDILRPVVAIVAPSPGGAVSGVVNVEVFARDESGIALELAIGGQVVASRVGATLAFLTFQWNSSSHVNGIYSLTARASDPSGNVRTDEIFVVLANPVTTPPPARPGPPPALFWFNGTTRQVASWELVGSTVTATRLFNGGVPAAAVWTPVGAGDLNADGTPDIVWRHADGTLAAWMMQDGIAIATQFLVLTGGTTPLVVDPEWQIGGVGDLNADGSADLVWKHQDGSVAVWFMRGFSVLQTALLSIPSVTDANWQIAAAGDLDADGHADIVWQHLTTGAVAAWFMDGNHVRLTRLLSFSVASDVAWRVRAAADVNNDGYADLLWQHADGRLAVWQMQGIDVSSTGYLSIAVVDAVWTVFGPG